MAQLGGAHVACENASNILTKVLEWETSIIPRTINTLHFYDKKLMNNIDMLFPMKYLR